MSDPLLTFSAYLDTANTDKKFKMRLSWGHYNANTDVVSDSSHDVDVEVDTGVASQYQSFQLTFTMDYDVGGAGNELAIGERLCLRIRRIAASSAEITGEVVIVPPLLQFLTDKA